MFIIIVVVIRDIPQQSVIRKQPAILGISLDFYRAPAINNIVQTLHMIQFNYTVRNLQIKCQRYISLKAIEMLLSSGYNYFLSASAFGY